MGKVQPKKSRVQGRMVIMGMILLILGIASGTVAQEPRHGGICYMTMWAEPMTLVSVFNSSASPRARFRPRFMKA